jgi:hypothetical protein
MDALHIAIALGPLATYLVVLGIINLSSRPLVTTAARDAATLAIALAGFVVVGPMELFLAEEAAALYGGWVWGIMLVAYALIVLLVVLLLRPRIIVYNITLMQLRPLLADVVARLDPEARWAGESFVMPRLGLQLHLEAAPLLNNVQLVSSGNAQSLAGWRQLETELAASLRRTRTPAHPLGVSLLSLGLLTAGTVVFMLLNDPGGVTQALNEMLRR